MLSFSFKEEQHIGVYQSAVTNIFRYARRFSGYNGAIIPGRQSGGLGEARKMCLEHFRVYDHNWSPRIEGSCALRLKIIPVESRFLA